MPRAASVYRLRFTDATHYDERRVWASRARLHQTDALWLPGIRVAEAAATVASEKQRALPTGNNAKAAKTEEEVEEGQTTVKVYCLALEAVELPNIDADVGGGMEAKNYIVRNMQVERFSPFS